MLKLPRTLKFISLATVVFTSISLGSSANAVTFDEQEVDQAQFIAIARPYGEKKYDLLIIQQIPGQQQCWGENGANPVLVNPLLLNFDFTGSCERSTDSNGYSVRIDGQDYGINYLLRVVERNGELILVATSRTDAKQPEIVVGRTNGITQGFMKIILNPGWRFSKRTYEGKILSHVYLSGDHTAMSTPTSSSVATYQTPASSNAQSLPSEGVREFTFTAEDTNTRISPNTLSNNKPLNSPPPNNRPLPPLLSPQASSSDIQDTTSAVEDSNTQTPPVTPSPLPPPPQQATPAVDIPPPLDSTSSPGRKSLSDVLVVAPRSLPNGNSPTPPTPGSDWGTLLNQVPTSGIAQASRYRVMVTVENTSQKEQVRSLYPDAFPTVYNGQSLWQVGVFSTQENAQEALQSLNNSGLQGLIVQ